MNHIVCIGRLSRVGESAGQLIHEMLENRELPPDVELLDGSRTNLDFDAVAGKSDRLVFIDSVPAMGNPGEVHLIRDRDLLHEHFSHDGQEIDQDNLTVLLGLLGGNSPIELVLVGIEPPLDRVALWRAAEMGIVLADRPAGAEMRPTAFGWTA